MNSARRGQAGWGEARPVRAVSVGRGSARPVAAGRVLSRLGSQGAARYGRARRGAVRLVSPWLGSLGQAGLGKAWHVPSRQGLFWQSWPVSLSHVWAWLGLARHGSHGRSSHGRSSHGPSGQSWPVALWLGLSGHGGSRQFRFGSAARGRSRQGTVGLGSRGLAGPVASRYVPALAGV